MLKNVLLRSRVMNGKKTWTLIGPDGREVTPFRSFADTMQNQINTMDSFCRGAAHFLDYVIEAVNCLGMANLDFNIGHFELDEIINSYREYLEDGINSENPIVALVCAEKPVEGYTPATVSNMIAARNKFLRFSEKIRREIEELSGLGLIEAYTDPIPLSFGTIQREQISLRQKQALSKNSVLASVVKGGPKFIRKSAKKMQPVTPYKPSRAFPIEMISQFIDRQKTYRDKCYYSFLAASSCRKSENDQILMSDMNFRTRSVKLVDPRTRLNSRCYFGLSLKEKQQLVWKGRVTESTFLLEPFATMFFDFAERYLRHEYIPHGEHGFFYQTESGAPLFLDKSGTQHKNFHRVKNELLLGDDIDGAHCIRHGIATYLINHCPRKDGKIGLDILDVAYILGHGNIKSTMIYANKDKNFRLQIIEHANSVIFGGVNSRDFSDILIEYHENQILELKKSIGVIDND